jgi:DNA-binding beta-propeller fold protein YncE
VNGDPNNPTGDKGLIAIDKRGCFARFLDPRTFEEQASFELPARPHEVAISPDHTTAYVSIYGSGIYGNNPQPDHRVVVIDLQSRQITRTFDVSPFLGPHGLCVDDGGLVYVSCDASGVVAVVDPGAGEVVGTIDVGSKGNHMITMLPDGSKLYSENEDQAAFVSVMDPRERRRIGEVPIPSGALGLCASSKGHQVLVADGGEPVVIAVDTTTDRVVDRVRLEGYAHPAQRVRSSPNGRFIVVTADQEPLATVMDASDLRAHTTFEVAPGPMGVAFHPDSVTALVANHGSGRITVVNLESASPVREFPMGVGVETLAFF